MKINFANVVYIDKYINSENLNYKWKVKRKFLGLFGKEREGFIYTHDISETIVEEGQILKNSPNCFISDKKVYYKPHAKILLVTGTNIYKFFDSETALNNFIDFIKF